MKKPSQMECKKCRNSGTILLRTKDFYCEYCFLNNINHKFRACIGKHKILSRNENVLVCLSGGIGSTVLLDLIHNGMSMENHKKLRITPFFLHLVGLEDGTNSIQVTEQCKKYIFSIYLIHMSEYIEASSKLAEVNCLPPANKDLEDQLQTMLRSMSATACNDLLPKIKQHLYYRIAKMLDCNFIFTAETTTTLAGNLLLNLALGRGSQVENDLGFCDTRDEKVKLLRPMRDISKEELDHYIKIKRLNPTFHNDIKENSLQSVIKIFVTDLQESFPATISTVCKTADKIGVLGEHEKGEQCIICKSNITMKNFQLSALQATHFSRTVSNGKPQNYEFSDDNFETLQEGQDTNKAMFPFVHKYLCYACSRNYSEMDIRSKRPNHLQTLLEK